MKKPDKIRVLLLTDSLTINEILKNILDPHQFTLFTLDSSQNNYFQEIIKIKPGLIFLRTMLKNFNGIEICDKIRTTPHLNSTKLIFLSSDPGIREQAINHRADQFLTMPFTANDLSKAIAPLFYRKPSILFADDSRLCHGIVVHSLQDEGYQVFPCWDGEEAYRIFQNEQIDLLVLDVGMPKLDGLSLCKKVKASGNNTPVLLLTSATSEKAINRGFEAGADDYITKPSVLPELLSRIKRLLQSGQIQERPEQVLVADHIQVTRSMICNALKMQGFRVDETENGQEALKKLRQDEYHLLITEADLPKLDGLELCIRIRQHPTTHNLPIIIMTSKDTQANQIKLHSTGIQAYITKPFNTDRIIAEVERVLADIRLEQHRQAIRHYVSDSTVHRITDIQAQGGTIAEDKFRTILFSDIVSFTTLCEKLSSRKVVEFLNLYFDHMVEALMYYDATIDKFIGDAIFASFGRQDDGAHRAICAAQMMLDTLPFLHKMTEQDVHVRIGINSGHVILGDIGSRHYRRDFTLIGDNVNTAQRLQNAASIDSILISQSTYDMVQEKVKVKAIAPLRLKGKKKLIKAYKILTVAEYIK